LFIVLDRRVGTVQPNFQAVYEGTNFNISCFSYYSPVWRKNGIPIKTYTWHDVTYFFNATQDDTAKYTCEGTYRNGTKFFSLAEVYVGGEIVSRAMV